MRKTYLTKYISCGFATTLVNSEVKGQCSATVGVREVQQQKRAYGAETDPQGTLKNTLRTLNCF